MNLKTTANKILGEKADDMHATRLPSGHKANEDKTFVSNLELLQSFFFF